jgi:hypothetical protein
LRATYTQLALSCRAVHFTLRRSIVADNTVIYDGHIDCRKRSVGIWYGTAGRHYKTLLLSVGASEV